jgi:Arc/MetJ-type ribon-helix-helix transcriptional regulator
MSALAASSMVNGMATTKKVTVTLREDQLGAIRGLVADGRAESVSGFVQDAVALWLQEAAGWGSVIDDILAETGGPPTEAEREWARAVMDGEEAVWPGN